MTNEKRLIDANALIVEANAEGAYGYVDAKQIADAPTVDAVEVRHGRWIMGTGENGLQTEHRKCSRCGEIVKYGYSLYGVHNFCNYCGAKMDGDDVNG